MAESVQKKMKELSLNESTSKTTPIPYQYKVEGKKLILAQENDFTNDAIIYIKDKKAQITSVEYPIIFFKYDGSTKIKHRNYLNSQDIMAIEEKSKESKKDSSSNPSQPPPAIKPRPKIERIPTGIGKPMGTPP